VHGAHPFPVKVVMGHYYPREAAAGARFGRSGRFRRRKILFNTFKRHIDDEILIHYLVATTKEGLP
jgi:hypothetical protein